MLLQKDNELLSDEVVRIIPLFVYSLHVFQYQCAATLNREDEARLVGFQQGDSFMSFRLWDLQY